jgi:hypothetical protein
MIVVNHCKKLKERKVHMINQMLKAGIRDYWFNECLDADDIKDCIDRFYVFDKDLAIRKTKSTSQSPPYWAYKPLKITEVSLVEKNITALSLFQNDQSDYLFVLEDDVEFIKEFDIGRIVRNAPKGWFAIFVGGFTDRIQNTTIVESTGQYHLVSHPATNGACAIIYNHTSALLTLQFLSGQFGYHLPFDWELNHIFKFYNADVYHYDYICKQLSKTTMETSLV